MTEVHIAETDEAYEDGLSVRYSVFVDEQGVDPDIEVDDHEEESTHFVAYEEGDPVGVARLRAYDPGRYEDAPATEQDGSVAKIERMAVLRSHRGRGVGRAILKRVEGHAREQGYDRARLHAQVRSTGFYENLGYKRVGEEFEEAGIPHVVMEKRL
jgi:predicted GNAT family N-acyltransferase